MEIATSSFFENSARRATSVRRLAAGWLCLLAVAGPAVAADSPPPATSLRWKFKQGEILHYTMNQSTTNSYKPKNGVEATSLMSQIVDLHWTVRSVSADGAADLTQTVDRIRTRIEGAGQPSAFEFDSDSKQPPADGPIAAQLVPLLKTLVGAEFTYKMSAMGELTDVKVPDTLMESVRQANSGGGKTVFSDEGMKNLVTQSGLTLPEKPIDPGGTWNHQNKVPLPLLGTMVMDKTYRLKGTDASPPRRAEIELETRVTIQPAPQAGVALKIKSQDGKGEFAFDLDRGRVVSSRVEDLLVMTLSVQDQEIDQSTKTVTEMRLSPESAGK